MDNLYKDTDESSTRKVFDMIDLFYANKHLRDKVCDTQERMRRRKEEVHIVD